jgi:antirestriction protein ArdC
MNVYETVTERLIASLEAGRIPWRQPWKASAEGGCIPFNRHSGKSYRGINIWLLGCAPYSTNGWMTYKQAAEQGAHVRKGEKGWPVVFWKFDRNKDTETGEQHSSVLMRQYTVFNVDQIEGLPQSLPFDLPPFNPIESAQAIVDKYFSSKGAPTLAHGGDSAFYRPSTDSIQMPKPETFFKPEGYYTTLFHESGHSTGHPSRCDRKDGMNNFFGDHSYSKEELTAEFTAAFLCAHCGISNEYTETNSAAYLQSWIRAFKNDSRVAVSAAQRAQKACDFIMNGGAVATSEESAEVAA